MRIDLTVRDRAGVDHDVALTAPAGATFDDVGPGLRRIVPGARAGWIGDRVLRSDAELGRPPLLPGAVVTECRADREHPAGRQLAVVGGPGAGRRVLVASRPITVGRDPACELALPDPRASRRHACFRLAADRLTVSDLASTHGTWVDGVQIEGSSELAGGCLIRVGDSFLTETDGSEPVAATRLDTTTGHLELLGATREPALPVEKLVHLPGAPSRQAPGRIQWIACLLPAIAGAVLAWLMHSMLFLAFAALSPVAIIATSVSDRWHTRRGARRDAADRHRVLTQVRARIAASVLAETRARAVRDPDPVTLARIAETPTARLWQRAGDDLLRVRVGIGPAPSAVRIEQDGTSRPAATLPAVPHTVDLAAGPVGVVGPRPLALGQARWFIAQLATLVSPADVELVAVLPGARERDWRWLRWLPHLGDRVATAPDEVGAVLHDVGELLDRRRSSAEATRAAAHSRERPWLVVLVDGDLDAGQSGELASLLADGPALGVTALILARDAASLVTPGAFVLAPDGDTGTTVRCLSVRSPASADGAVVADQVGHDWAERVARALAPLRDARQGRGSALPRAAHLLDLLGEPTPESMQDRWAAGDGGAGTTIGVDADGPLGIDLARDGPHLLIAGTTGAGKSELLQTLVSGLAAEHPPSAMTFLLVDYKGGAAFAECAALPHTIGLVTDLDERMTGRVLASLDSEIRRREAMLAAAGAHDLPSFRAGGGELARLIVVIDEFATLVDELPGFVSGLVSIAQRGRSLGLHLVLATQRPAGVVSPEIRANVGLRICLRVTDGGESGDVIDAPYAAAIDRHTPGRGFIRNGPGLVAFQAARVAGRASPDDTAVTVVPLDAWRRPVLPPADDVDGPTDLSRLVDAARTAAVGSPAPHRPWLPPLRDRVELDSITPDGDARPGDLDTVPIGLLDLPAEQRQSPLMIDVGSGGVILVAGSARSGRSTLLRTLAIACARRSPPDRLHLHALTASGTRLGDVAELPHAGTIAGTRDGFDLAARLIARLAELLAARRDMTAAALAAEPAVLLLLDGWETFLAGAEEYDGGRTVERLHALLADAPAARATVVITGGRAVLAPRVSAHAATRLVLACHDPADYAAAGLDPRAAPAPIAGRGLRVGDQAEFQIAVDTSAAPTGARDPAALRLRALPQQVALDALRAPPGRIVLGVGGDGADPLAIDLTAGGGRLLVAGPPRSGRTQALITLLHQSQHQSARLPTVVAAPRRSPLAAAALRHGARLLAPDDVADAVRPGLSDALLLLVDDLETFADTAVGDELTRWTREAPPGTAVCAAGRCDALAVAFRGLGAELRRARCGVLLQPGPVDGELFGARLPRARPAPLPGRGVLFPDPAWGQDGAPIPIQLAVSPCADTCDPSAGRRSP